MGIIQFFYIFADFLVTLSITERKELKYQL